MLSALTAATSNLDVRHCLYSRVIVPDEVAKEIRAGGREVLIDPPAKKDIFDYADLKELRVYPTLSEHIHYAMLCTSECVRFDDLNESVFQSDFILAFEWYTKKFRLLCRSDLVERIVESREAIMCLMANDLDLFR